MCSVGRVGKISDCQPEGPGVAGIWPPRGEIPSDLALPGPRSLGILPPLKFRDFAPPLPLLHFQSSYMYFLYIIGGQK